MRLRKHRDDVKSLQLMQDNYVQEIARRYLNMIRSWEKLATVGIGEKRSLELYRKVRWDAEGR